MNVDKRGYLKTEPFEYQVNKNGTVFLFWEGKQIKMLKGKEAQQFINKLDRLDTQNTQLLLAKLTGNFKRGNERG